MTSVMALKEMNQLRLERLTKRLSARRAGAADEDARSQFEAAFVAHRDEVLTPLLRDVGAELTKAGHAFTIEPDGDRRRPSIVFRVELAGGNRGNTNAIGFYVGHDDAAPTSEVIAYLELKNEFDLGRYRAVSEMTRDALEQLLVDAVEHMLVCNE
jgi:hypothetical protein